MPGLPVVVAKLDSPFAPVEDDELALVGDSGVERIADQRAAGIPDLGRHGVVDVDAVPENASVAVVPVVVLALDVQFPVPGVLVDVPVKAALVFEDAGAAVRVPEFAVVAVDVQLAVGHDFDGVGVDPPVQFVEVVRSLVTEQSAGICLKACQRRK